MIDVSIIVVGTNERDYVLQCLESIDRSRAEYVFETLLVDNASSDGTAERVREKHEGVLILRNDVKRGYIDNNNMALERAQGRYILTLNADIEIEADTLQVMVRFMDEHPEAAVSACKLVFGDGALQLTCRRFPTVLTYFQRLPHFFQWLKIGKSLAKGKQIQRYLMLDYDHRTVREVDWLVSAFFLLRRTAIEDIGKVGEQLMQPFYIEDMDWCFRARMKGWKVYYVPAAQAVHHYQRTSVKKFGWLSVVHMVNVMIFFKKHGWAMMRGRHKAWA